MLKQFTSVSLLLIIIFFVSASENLSQNGVLRSYYSKKKLQSEISYVNDVLDGTSTWYYENGNLKEQKVYTNGKLNGWVKSYYESGLVKEEYYLSEGVLDGIASYYYDNGALKEVNYYRMGQLTSSQQLAYDSNYTAPLEAYSGTSARVANGGNPFELLCDVKICAEPLGGMEEIQKKIVYPQYAKLYGLEGIVILVVKVDVLGNVVSTTVIKSLGLGCDEAAQESVEQTRFIPGQDESGVVVSSVTIQVEFKLDDADKQLETDEAKKQEPTASEKINEPGKNIIAKGECGFDVCPQPVGGIETIINNIKLPVDSIYQDLYGTIIIRADIDKFGNVIKTLVIDGINFEYNSAVETAVWATRFYPAVENGVRVSSVSTIKIPITN